MSNDQHDDERVSAMYKKLANERTPEHLDRKILAMAASAASKPTYSRWMRWSRPAAWAATIVLCLAITIELAQGPAMDMSIEANIPASAPAIDERKRDNEVRDDEVAVEQDLADGQILANDRDRSEYSEAAKDKNSAKEERSLSIKPADLERQQEVAESIAESAASEKTSLARSASKQSLDAPPAPTRALEAQMMSGAAMTDEVSPDSTCSAEVRADASDWLECITELEARGLDELAAAERELLIDTFPDFKLP